MKTRNLTALGFAFAIAACGITSDSRSNGQQGTTGTADFGRGQSSGLMTPTTPLAVPANGILPTTTNASGNAVGALDGSVTVTSDGAAVYSLPFWVPPGRSGMQPSLGLAYHSRAGNGLLGVGWSLTGASKIARCTQSRAQNGANAAVQFAATDVFCLDGQQLVAISGPYGAAGTVYRTARDSFAKIVGGTVDAEGPLNFTVYYKDGRIGYFGNTTISAHSRVEGNVTTLSKVNKNDSFLTANYTASQARYAWALSAVQDLYNNCMVFNYALDATTAFEGAYFYEHRLTSIQYTAKCTPNPDSSANRTVTFNYQPRASEERSYVAGFGIRLSQRLSSIQMAGPDPSASNTLKTYNFSYSSSPATERDLLTSIQECGRNEGTVNKCFAPTTFTYEPGSNVFWPYNTGLAPGANGLPASTYIVRVLAADINGDGLDDILILTGPTAAWYYSLSQKSTDGSIVYGPATKAPFTNPTIYAVDLDLDGAAEIIEVAQGTPPVILGQCQAGIVLVQEWFINTYQFNMTSGAFQKSTPGSNSFYTNAAYVAACPIPPSTIPIIYSIQDNLDVYVADVNGDGRPDLIIGNETNDGYAAGSWGPKAFLSINNGTPGTIAFLPPIQTFPTVTPYYQKQGALAADTNGNGVTESLLVHLASDGMTPTTFFRTELDASNNILAQAETGLHADSAETVWLADLNGDGLLESVSANSANGGLPNIQLNTGAGYETAYVTAVNDASYQIPPSPLSTTRVAEYDVGPRFFDFDGDGKTDIWTHLGSLLVTRVGASGAIQFTETPIVTLSSDLTTTVNLTGADTSLRQVMDANGDGLKDLLYWNGTSLVVLKRTGKPSDVLTNATNGLGAYQNISYTTSYSPCTAATYPLFCANTGIEVVSGVTRFNGVADDTTSYSFSDSRLHLTGFGWLGFGSSQTSHTVWNTSVPSIETTSTTYNSFAVMNGLPNSPNATPTGTAPGNYYPFVGEPLSVTVTTVMQSFDNGIQNVKTTTFAPSAFYTALAATTGSLSPFQTYVPISTLTETEGSVNCGSSCTTVRQITKVETRDKYGRVSQASTATSDGFTDTIVNTYYPANETTWLINLLQQRVVASTTPGGQFNGTACTSSSATCGTRISGYSYYTGTTALQTETVEPTRTNPATDLPVHIQTTLGRDTSNGQVTSVTMTDLVGAKRTLSIGYDTDKTFPAIWTDALNHTLRIATHPGFGVPLITEDPNLLQTTLFYDDFGRLRATQSPDGAVISQDIKQDATSNNTPYQVVSGNDGSSAMNQYDILGRVVLQSQIGFGGAMRSIVFAYDGVGNQTSISLPFFGAESGLVGSTTRTFDELGRLRSIIYPDGAKTVSASKVQAIFSGLTRTVTDENGHQTVFKYDQRNRVVGVTESVGGQTLTSTYAYGPFGVLLSATPPSPGVSVQFTYDVLGRKVTTQDPNAGLVTTHYNAFGELTSMTDGASRTSTVSMRDGVGRVLQRVDEAADGGTSTRSFSWDPPNGIGYVNSAAIDGADSATVTYSFNALSQVSAETRLTNNHTYVVSYKYDNLGRMSQVTYPVVSGMPQFVVQYGYDPASGELASASDASNGTTLLPLWKAVGEDPAGRIVQEQFGNNLNTVRTFDNRDRLRFLQTGTAATVTTTPELQQLAYAYDAVGNLTARNDISLKNAEYFGYDELNRLIDYQYGSSALAQCGRLHIGLSYDALGNLKTRTVLAGSGTSTVFNYGERGLGAHQLSSSADNGGALYTGYSYDGDGNQRTAAGGRVIEFTAENLPRSVTVGTSVTTYSYDAEGAKVLEGNLSTATGTVYFPEFYEMRTVGSTTAQYFHVNVGGRRVAERVLTASGSVHTYFVHGELIDSADVVTDESSGIVERKKYEPFGGRRSPNNLAVPMAPAPTVITSVGFAGHEDDVSGLLNMKGRLYDSYQARFISTDILYDGLPSSQGFHLYAYVGNNPAGRRDPTGFDVGNAQGSDEADAYLMAAAARASSCAGLEGCLSLKVPEAPNTLTVTSGADDRQGAPPGASSQALAMPSWTTPAANYAQLPSSGSGGVAPAWNTPNLYTPPQVTYGGTLVGGLGAAQTFGKSLWNGYANPGAAATTTLVKTSVAVARGYHDYGWLGVANVFNPFYHMLVHGAQAQAAYQAGDSETFGYSMFNFDVDVVQVGSVATTGLGMWRSVGGLSKGVGPIVIGRTVDLANILPGERTLLGRLTPRLETHQLNWKRNAGVLRDAMNEGRPIRDASPGDTGGWFLNAERALLRERGWMFDAKTNFWMPPGQ